MKTRTSAARTCSDAQLLAELALRLHDGPLYSMAALYREAAALAIGCEAGGACDVERLAQLAQVAESTLVRFQAFTGELNRLLGKLAAEPTGRFGPRPAPLPRALS